MVIEGVIATVVGGPSRFRGGGVDDRMGENVACYAWVPHPLPTGKGWGTDVACYDSDTCVAGNKIHSPPFGSTRRMGHPDVVTSS